MLVDCADTLGGDPGVPGRGPAPDTDLGAGADGGAVVYGFVGGGGAMLPPAEPAPAPPGANILFARSGLVLVVPPGGPAGISTRP